jgi:hypothetical protein
MSTYTLVVDGHVCARVSAPERHGVTVPSTVNERLVRALSSARHGAPITGPAHDLSQIVRYTVLKDGHPIVESFSCAPVVPFVFERPSVVTA